MCPTLLVGSELRHLNQNKIRYQTKVEKGIFRTVGPPPHDICREFTQPPLFFYPNTGAFTGIRNCGGGHGGLGRALLGGTTWCVSNWDFEFLNV